MLEKLVAYTLKQKGMVIFLLLLIIAIGLYSYFRRGVAIAAASFLTYGFGQALTDCFQVDTDAISAPYRPLTRGEVRARDVMIVSLVGLVACVTVFITMSPQTVVPGILGVVGLATYTWFKRRWWGGPAYNALIVVILFVMAGSSADGSIAFVRDPASPPHWVRYSSDTPTSSSQATSRIFPPTR